MKLSKEHRAKLVKQGFSAKDIEDIESATTDPEPEAEGRRAKASKPRRVFMLEGDDADSFLERLFGSKDETPEDEPDEDEGGEGETEPEAEEPEQDEEPGSSVGYFRERKRKGA